MNISKNNGILVKNNKRRLEASSEEAKQQSSQKFNIGNEREHLEEPTEEQPTLAVELSLIHI